MSLKHLNPARYNFPYTFYFFFGLAILVIIAMLVNVATIEYVSTGKEVLCYDNNDNEIINVTCKEVILCGYVDKLFSGECRGEEE